jgi:outer membrane protein assembly factor BamB
MCVDPTTGDYLWGIDMVKEYNTQIPFWYTGQCPLIENDIAVLAPGGSALLIGVDCATGETVWETPNPEGWTMSHSSIMPMEFNGVKMYVYAAIGGICGVAAEGSNTGAVVWKTNEFAPSVVAPSPLPLENGKILITAGYGAGSMLFQLVPGKNGFEIETVQKYKPKDGLASEQQTPIFYKGHIFSVLPKDAGANRNQFVCCTPDDCQTFIWTSGKTERFGLGPYMVADDKFFILDDEGTLTIARASERRFEPISKTKLFDGQDAWGPMALANGYLLVRDSKTMFCIDVNKN